MIAGQVLTLASVSLQSVGKVLYGTFLTGVSTPLFVLTSFLLTASIFLLLARFGLPRQARGQLVLVNLWTAVMFASFFYALNHLPPAVVASVEIGMSLLMAVALTSVQNRAWPPFARALACLGIIAGCAVLAWVELSASLAKPDASMVSTAILASVATGISVAFAATASRRLATAGWTAPQVLAHRFYVTLLLAALWLPMQSHGEVVPEISMLGIMLGVGAIGILIPLLLLQIAFRRVDELIVLICMAVQPILSFAFSLPSPAYDWNALTLTGVLIVTLSLAGDGRAGRSART